MRSVAIATVVVLMVLRTAAYTDTTTPFTTTTSPSTTTTSAFTTTTSCPLPPCSYLPGCGSFIGSDGCIHCGCNTCDNTSCAEGEKCELLPDDCWSRGAPCLPEPVCVSTTEPPTAGPTAEPTLGPTGFFPPPYCTFVTCHPDEQCVQNYENGAGYTCVPTLDTTTPFTTTTETPTPFTTTPEMTSTTCPPLPPYARLPGYGTFIDQDGCLILKFYTCDEVCGVGQECELQPCYDDPCSLPAVCGSTTETTTGTTTGTPTPSVCPSIIWCGESDCSLDYSSGECPTCVCSGDSICGLFHCRPDEECVRNVELPSESTCVSIYETTTPCPMIECSPPCVSDQLGDRCPTCACPPSCEDFNCTDGSECVLVNVNCFRAPCFPQPNCVATNSTSPPPVSCQPVTCLPDCVSDVGPDGCTTCVCPRVCNMLCMIGYECVLVNVTCEQDPCFPEPKCVPKQETTAAPCRMYKCAPNCVPGNGSDGCPTCECPPSCQTVKCSAGHECELVNVTCKRDPCFPQPQCVAIKNPCTGTPNPRRCGRSNNRWTYNSATNKCEKFRYYGCTPSLNTFLSPKACRNKCQGGAQTVCEDVVCEKNCYTYTRKNKCSKCICPNPCKGFKCREGYECKLRDAKCEDKDPKPFCAKISCPPQDPCGIRCMYGLKTDKNGCQLCECLKEPRP